MTATDLADAAQLTPATVRRLLAGNRVRMSTAVIVLEALQLRWDETITRLADAPESIAADSSMA